MKSELKTSSQAASSHIREVYYHPYAPPGPSHSGWLPNAFDGGTSARAIPIHSSPLRPSANQKASPLDKLRTWLLSQEHDTERRAAINVMISHCRQQMVEIDQIKEAETCTMLTGMGCKFGIIKAVQGKIHDFKTWYKRDLEITREEQEEAAARSLAELASGVSGGEQDDGFWED
jgi:hypothetical protein